MADFKPSEVALDVFPLVGTMGKAEIEYAAAALLRALVVDGDEWKPLTLKRVGEVAQDDMQSRRRPMLHWYDNPFMLPNPPLMVERGFAVFGESVQGDTIAFTERGREALRRWVGKGASLG